MYVYNTLIYIYIYYTHIVQCCTIAAQLDASQMPKHCVARQAIGVTHSLHDSKRARARKNADNVTNYLSGRAPEHVRARVADSGGLGGSQQAHAQCPT